MISWKDLLHATTIISRGRVTLSGILWKILFLLLYTTAYSSLSCLCNLCVQPSLYCLRLCVTSALSLLLPAEPAHLWRTIPLPWLRAGGGCPAGSMEVQCLLLPLEVLKWNTVSAGVLCLYYLKADFCTACSAFSSWEVGWAEGDGLSITWPGKTQTYIRYLPARLRVPCMGQADAGSPSLNDADTAAAGISLLACSFAACCCPRAAFGGNRGASWRGTWRSKCAP